MVFTVNYSLLSEEERSWCCVKLSVHLLNNSNKEHQMKMRATYETSAWEKDLATKDSFTNSNVAKTCHEATVKSRESCHQVQRISAIRRSYMVLEREPFSAGGNELPGGRDANTPKSEKGKTFFAQDGEKYKNFLHSPKWEWPLLKQHLSPWQQGLSTNDISVWFGRFGLTLWQLCSYCLCRSHACRALRVLCLVAPSEKQDSHSPMRF